MAIRLLALLILLAGCVPDGAAQTTDVPASTTTTSQVTTTTDPGPPPTTAAAAPPCLAGDEPFTSRTTGVVGRPDGDAAAIAGLRWEDFDGCQRVVVSLATADQAPATRSGQVEVSVRSDLGVVRIDFGTEVEHTAVADAVMDTSLVAGAYVVRDIEGGLFLDLHTETSVEVRAMTPSAPARVVVDLRPVGERGLRFGGHRTACGPDDTQPAGDVLPHRGERLRQDARSGGGDPPHRGRGAGGHSRYPRHRLAGDVGGLRRHHPGRAAR